MKWLLPFLFISALATCARIGGTVRTEAYTAPKQNATYAIIGAGEQNLTDNRVRRQIAARLDALGFRPAKGANEVDLAVLYSYDIAPGVTSVHSHQNIVTNKTVVSSATRYPRYFQISVVDARASDLKNRRLSFVWQGEVRSAGGSTDMYRLSEHFIDELFIEFGRTTNRSFSRPFD